MNINIIPDRPSFICDMDDSLIFCGRNYDLCKQEFFKYMNALGMTKEDCARRFNRIDLERAKDKKIDFEGRFPGSMVYLFKMWCYEKKIPILPEKELEVSKIGYSVYDTMYEPMPDAHNMLYELSQEYDLFLYTKGDKERQIKKILKADLDLYFKAVWITDSKTVSRLTAFMIKHNLNVKTTWVLGNSPACDIVPAYELGVPSHQLIWIDSYMWAEDNAPLPVGVHKIKSLGEVVPLTRQLAVEGLVE